MPYITSNEVIELTTNDKVKAMPPNAINIYIAGAEAMLGNYSFDITKPNFDNAIKLAALLLVDYIAFSNTGGGAFETERIGDISYNMRDRGLQKKMSEVETILGPYIVAGGKRMRTSRLVRK